jgi:hypothetical protein
MLRVGIPSPPAGTSSVGKSDDSFDAMDSANEVLTRLDDDKTSVPGAIANDIAICSEKKHSPKTR